MAPAKKKSSAKSVREPRGAAKVSKSKSALDAVELLMRDHKQVSKRFKEFAKSRASDKKALADTICGMLEVHTQIEQEIFYPALRAASAPEGMMDEADVEHEGATDLIAKIRAAAPGEDHYDAKVKVLSEYIEHHVDEEEQRGGMFSKAKKLGLDLEALGAALAARAEELKATKGLKGLK